MTIELDRIARNINPTKTVVFFGAGSSIPSGSPSTNDLKDKLAEAFSVERDGFELTEIAELAELNSNRSALIKVLRGCFSKPNPTGGLLNIPLYPWKGIYTTNYDKLIERAYEIRRVGTKVITTNFDFSTSSDPLDQPIFKIHGTIDRDICDGDRSRIILTQSDYDAAREYREFLFNRLQSDMAGADLILIGYSLNDPDIKATVDRVLSIQSKMAGAGGSVYLILYQRDENRAKLFEARGVRVAFGGIDEFSEILARVGPAAADIYSTSNDPVQESKTLSATTIDVQHAMSAFPANANAMFNGWPATFADISGGLTFNRTVANSILNDISNDSSKYYAITGASGVGKTTAARQVITQMAEQGWLCWEHKSDFDLPVSQWTSAAEKLHARKIKGILLIDDAHLHISNINRLVDELESKSITTLVILMTSGKAQWQYRTKSVYLTKTAKEYHLSKLNGPEIDRLITLVSSSPHVRPLVEATFSGFSYSEKRKRLADRCEADAFVCLRNIFAQEKFDDIILREFNEMSLGDQEIYKIVSAMQHAGIRVHRQLVLRMTGIAAGTVAVALQNLVDVLSEYDISERFGIFGWKVRHGIIAGIITKFKFHDTTAKIRFFENLIKNLSPSYELERQSINEMCNIDSGLPSIPDKNIQNQLLRALISLAPGEPVPRHRLIRNLIDLEKFDLAETEIRVFQNEVGLDGPVARYKIALLLARAIHTPGLSADDRVVILRDAESQGTTAAGRFKNNRHVLTAFCEVGFELLKRTNDAQCFDNAIKALKAAELRTGDDEIVKTIRQFEKRRFEVGL